MKELNSHQVIISQWADKAIGPDRSLEGRLLKFAEEVEEVKEITVNSNLEHPINRRRLAEELTDVIVSGLDTLNILGYDVDNLIFRVLDTNYRKYSPEYIDHLVTEGYTRQEAVSICKARWRG